LENNVNVTLVVARLSNAFRHVTDEVGHENHARAGDARRSGIAVVLDGEKSSTFVAGTLADGL